MAERVITSVEQVSAAYLTEVLRRNGALSEGAVAAFEPLGGRGNWSDSASLALSYTGDARGELPRRLFLKMVDTDTGDGEFFGDSEVTYYTRDYVDVPSAPLLRCYDAAYSETQRRYHLLLQDVSQTHMPEAQTEPTLAHRLAIVEGLAVMHAHWWGAHRLAEAEAPVHDAAHIRRFVGIAEPGVDQILARFSDELAPHWSAMLRELYARHPHALIARTRIADGFTLIHGDLNGQNILVPRIGIRPIYLIDRQPFDWSLTTWLGAFDLVYVLVMYWDMAKRRQHESAILQHYHTHLAANGVTDYSWEQLWHDYRLCVPIGAYIATEYCRGGINERFQHVWLPMLQRTLSACDDLDCRELWLDA